LRHVISTAVAITILIGGTGSASAQSGMSDPTPEQLGRRVLAIREAIENPDGPNAMQAVIGLGRDQRFYVMVRGWLSLQLEGDLSIANAQGQSVSSKIEERIAFLKRAIRAIDLE